MSPSKEINLKRLLAAPRDPSSIRAVTTDGPFPGVPCELSWEGDWKANGVREPFFRLSRLAGVDLHLRCALGSITLERAFATRNEFSGTVSGTCISTLLEATPMREGEPLTYRTFVRVNEDLQTIAFPGWLRDENERSSLALLPLRMPGLDVDVYYIAEGPFLVIETSQPGLTLDAFARISGAARQLLSYLLAIQGDGPSCDVVSSTEDESLRSARWYAGRRRDRHLYRPIPTSLSDLTDAAKSLGLGPLVRLEADAISRCLSTALEQPGLVAPIEYLLRFGNAPVEMRGAFLSVALESLTDQMEKRGLLATVKPLEDAAWKTLRKELREVVSRLNSGWTETQKSVVDSRINNLNSPTNADKLSRPFTLLGVGLTDDERDAIIKRNKFLHEGRLLDPEIVAGDPTAWKNAYAIEMRIYTAVNKLLLTYLGFEGAAIDWGNTERETGRLAFTRISRPVSQPKG